MDHFVKHCCRLCLCVKSKENFETISDFTMRSLDILLLKLDLDQSKHVICKVCALKVTEALKFKSKCLCVDNTITSYIDDDTGNSIDLLEIYAGEKGMEQLTVNLHGHKVCRLCMQLTKGKFMSVHEVEINAIEKYLPEINLSIIKDSVVCKQCFDSIGTHSSFIRNCLEVQEKICEKAEESVIKQEENEYEEDCMESKSIIETLGMKAEDSIIKQESEREEEYMENENRSTVETLNMKDEFNVKTECIDIKSEEDSGSEAVHRSPTYETDSETQRSKCKSGLEHHIIVLRRNIPLDPLENVKTEQVLSKENLFKCDKCNYQCRYRSQFRNYQLPHKDPSQVRMYKCNKCDLKTKYRWYIKRHKLRHRNPPTEEMYPCAKCSFATKYRYNLKTHQLVHKDPSQVQVYKCGKCSFKSKRKGDIKRHESRHKNAAGQESEKTFWCEICSFRTNYKNGMRQHQLTHKDPSQVEMYGCDECDFKTKYKRHIKTHKLRVHTNLPKDEMYQCDKCSFTTKYKNNFKMHHLVHKDPSQVEMYKCDKCKFQTKRKGDFKRHESRHNNTSRDKTVKIYKCEKCKFDTIYRQNLKKHQLTHMDPSQVQIYKCDKCSYETKYKSSWTKHRRTKHNNPLEVQLKFG